MTTNNQKESSISLAQKLKTASAELAKLAEELETENFSYYVAATETAGNIRKLLSERNNLMRQAQNLKPHQSDIKRAVILWLS